MDQSDDSSHDPWLADYDDHLQRVVGAAPATRQRYGTTVRRFLSSCFGTGAPNWAILSVETVVDFIRQEAATKNARGQPLSRDGVDYLLRRAVSSAAQSCPSLKTKRVSPHVLRHTTAMHLLQAGVDVAVIALWLGHESIETTHVYVEADLATKERALEKLEPVDTRFARYRADDALLDFLANL